MPSASRQHLVKVEGVPGWFANKSGGETTAETTDVYDGGKLTPDKLAGPPMTGDVTLTRPWDHDRDGPVARQLRPRVGSGRFTVTVQPTDAELVPVGAPTVYAQALLIGLADTEADAASSDPGTLELTFAISSVV